MRIGIVINMEVCQLGMLKIAQTTHEGKWQLPRNISEQISFGKLTNETTTPNKPTATQPPNPNTHLIKSPKQPLIINHCKCAFSKAAEDNAQ